MPDKKGGDEMEEVKQDDLLFGKDAESPVKAKDGAILLDRKNPIHRMWMEEDEE